MPQTYTVRGTATVHVQYCTHATQFDVNITSEHVKHGFYDACTCLFILIIYAFCR